MKSVLTTLKSVQLFGFLVGITAGVFIALCITYFYVLDGHARMKGYSVGRQNLEETCAKKFGISSNRKEIGDHAMMGHESMMNTTNPYMMAEVVSEEQFLKDMILHHEAAVEMAKQVLALAPSPNVEILAKQIIATQKEEIEKMKQWLLR